MIDRDWDEQVRKIHRQRVEVANTLSREINRFREMQFVPISISLAIEDARTCADTGSLPTVRGGGEVFWTSDYVASQLGSIPREQVEDWGRSGVYGFPPPARGGSSRDWLWSAGEISVWLNERSIGG